MRNGPKHLQGLICSVLAVKQMTRRIVSCALESYRRAVAKADRFHLLANVAHARAEVTRSFCVLFVFSQQVCVRGQHRATATGVGNNRAVLIGTEGIDVLTSQLARTFEVAGM